MGAFYLIKNRSSITFGSDKKCDFIISSSFVAGVHIQLIPAKTGLVVRLLVFGKNGVLVNGRQLSKGKSMFACRSDLISIDRWNVMWLGDYIYISDVCQVASWIIRHNLQATDQFKRAFVPSIRNKVPMNLEPIEIEGPPARKLPEKPSVLFAAGPALTMAVPMLLGCGRVISVISSVFAAFWAASNVINRHRKIKNEERRRKNTYISYIDECEQLISRRVEEIRCALNANFPEIHEYLKAGGNPFLLWNRDQSETGATCIRIGRGNAKLPLQITIPKSKFAQIDDSLRELPLDLKDKYQIIRDIPVTIDINLIRTLGFVYDSVEEITAVLLAFILQLAVTYKPSEISIYFDIINPGLRHNFEKIRFLPHVKYLVNTKNRISDSLAESDGDSFNDKEVNSIIITDDASLIKNCLNNSQCKVILLERKLSRLPSYVDEIIVRSEKFNGMISLNSGKMSTRKVNFDMVGPSLSNEYSRIIGKLAGVENASKAIPDSIAFGSLFNRLEKESILEIWNRQETCTKISFPVGIGENNALIELNLHENRHGPHGLIAGSTGSGKSELLSTIILSAAIMYPPDLLTFFLIDYKGGGMSGLFGRLPHLCGSISNLSISLTQRAMVSLKSENMRRQQVFLQCSVNNINDYTKGYLTGKFQEPLPHILVIIDEFAELKKENPEFISELITTAAIGRSLGIHLILATQKPGGVIDEKIRSNARFKICLRVEDKSDSIDMIRRPDAAFITKCGRAYLQVGSKDECECFQSGYVMGKKENNSSKEIILYDEGMNQIEEKDNGETEESWYTYFLNQVIEAKKEYKRESPRPLWLEPLSERIPYDNAYAICDDPENQRYLCLSNMTGEYENVLVVGMSMTGKSTFLATFLTDYILSWIKRKNKGPDLLIPEIYIVESSEGILKNFSGCNLCGGYIGGQTLGRLPMLLLHIREKIREGRRNGNEFNGLLVVDNYYQVFEDCIELAEEVIEEILKYGKKIGFNIAVTSTGVGLKEIPIRIAENFSRRIVLGQMDVYTTAGILKCPPKQLARIEDTQGRGFANTGEGVYEIQTAIIDGKIDGKEAITGVIEAVNELFIQKVPEYPYVPESATIEGFLLKIADDIIRIREVYPSGFTSMPMGYCKESGKIYCLPFDKVSCILIAGRAGTGKKTILSELAIIASKMNLEVISPGSLESISGLGRKRFLVILDNMEKLMEDFYQGDYSEEAENQLCNLFNNSVNKSSNHKFVINISETIRTKFQNTKIYQSILCKPYVIYMGGGIDEQRMFDFSYLPYQKQTKKLRALEGTVARYNGRLFYGDVVFPKMIWQEDE